jgi:hypothetical protein
VPHTPASLRDQACLLHLKATEARKRGDLQLSELLLKAALRNLESAQSLEAAESIARQEAEKEQPCSTSQ